MLDYFEIWSQITLSLDDGLRLNTTISDPDFAAFFFSPEQDNFGEGLVVQLWHIQWGQVDVNGTMVQTCTRTLVDSR